MMPSQIAEKRLEASCFEVMREISRAVEKHGYGRTPLSTDMGDASKLIILVEEVGEVARALTYDNADFEGLKSELIQVATMALAWHASLEGPA